MDLDSMKYSELQALAKALGLKANVKAEKLLKALKQHYNNGGNKEEQEQNNQNNQNNVGKDEKAPLESVQDENITKKCVTTRRGRGNYTKRKISATVDSTVPSDAAEGASEPAGPEQVTDVKRRKLSSSEDSEPSQEQQTTENKQQQIVFKAEAPVASQTEKPQNAATVGKIPRLQKSKPLLKPMTPNFKKLHEAQFNKMESIDSFFQRRTKQMETCKNPKEVKKTNPARTSLFSPAPAKKKATEAPAKRPAGKTEVLFRPSVHSTRRINVRFSEATFNNEHKRSLIKTPARMSPCLASSTPQMPAATAATTPKAVQASALSSTKTPKPFLFTGNNTSVSTTPGTQKKQNFDLKASLSRPLSYKPHTGKLKPFGEVNKSVPVNPRQESYKNHKVQSRDDRRTKIMKGRKNKKENLLGARRGLM